VPTTAVIDSQSVRAADTVPRAARGWDSPKKASGRKRHIAVEHHWPDPRGRGHPFLRPGPRRRRPLLWSLRRACGHVRLVSADAGYAGQLVGWANASLWITVETVRKRDADAFEVLHRRWVPERNLACISAHRRRACDNERLPASQEVMELWAIIALMA
jgi:hypothetical protein